MIPDSLDGWKVETIYVLHRWRLIARRGPITWMIVGQDGSWTVTKLRGGQVLSDVTVKNLPPDVRSRVRLDRRAVTA